MCQYSSFSETYKKYCCSTSEYDSIAYLLYYWEMDNRSAAKSETVFSLFEEKPPFIVSWSHYLQLMRIENEDEKSFYEIESAKSGWSVRT